MNDSRWQHAWALDHRLGGKPELALNQQVGGKHHAKLNRGIAGKLGLDGHSVHGSFVTQLWLEERGRADESIRKQKAYHKKEVARLKAQIRSLAQASLEARVSGIRIPIGAQHVNEEQQAGAEAAEVRVLHAALRCSVP